MIIENDKSNKKNTINQTMLNTWVNDNIIIQTTSGFTDGSLFFISSRKQQLEMHYTVIPLYLTYEAALHTNVINNKKMSTSETLEFLNIYKAIPVSVTPTKMQIMQLPKNVEITYNPCSRTWELPENIWLNNDVTEKMFDIEFKYGKHQLEQTYMSKGNNILFVKKPAANAADSPDNAYQIYQLMKHKASNEDFDEWLKQPMAPKLQFETTSKDSVLKLLHQYGAQRCELTSKTQKI